MTIQIENIQRGLVERGHDLGKTGDNKDGIDGDLGKRTLDAVHDEIGVPAPVAETKDFGLTDRDTKRLTGVHKDLVKIVKKLAKTTPVPFAILEGKRTIQRQRQLVAKGASKTMNSRHLTGHAVDIAPLDRKGKVSWDWPLYYKLAPAMKEAAAEVGVPIEWGGDWRSFKDGPHWQLPWRQYPKK